MAHLKMYLSLLWKTIKRVSVFYYALGLIFLDTSAIILGAYCALVAFVSMGIELIEKKKS